MKKFPLILLLSSLMAATAFAQNTFPSAGSAGIGTASPNASSLLEVKSTSKGILIPRMSQSQRDAIASPVPGLLIYQNNNTPGFYYYNGTAWTAVNANTGANRSLSNLTSPTAVNANLLPDITNTRNFGSSALSWHNGYFGGTLRIGAYTLPSTDGTNGQVLTTNGSGNASWKTISGSSQWTTNGSSIFFSSGNVGIGTSAPAYKLDVTGDINVSTNGRLRIGGTPVFFDDVPNGDFWIGGGGTSNIDGNDNTAVGLNALFSNSSGYLNTASGYQALYSNTSGGANTATGASALSHNTIGHQNTATGSLALFNNTTGGNNTANGLSALFYNTSGNDNTAVGYLALENNIENFNTACGYQALYQTTASQYNTAVGYNAGATYDNGYNNVFVGANTDASGAGFFNVIAIGQATVCMASSQAQIGNLATSSIGGFANWTNFSDVRYKRNIKSNVPGLEFINLLKPITYNLDVNGIEAKLHPNQVQGKTVSGEPTPDPMDNPDMKKAIQEKSQIIFTGFAAQDVEKAAKSLGYDFSGVDKPANDQTGFYGLRYGDFVVPIVKAVQELSAQNDLLKSQNESLQNRVTALEVNQNASITTGMVKVSVNNSAATTLLGQNIPNPFDHSTLIPFRIPGDCHDASIAIVETATGKIIHLIPVSCTETQLSFEAGSLASGNYSYSLYVDGKLVETKQMVLTK